ncbi:zinc finger protein 502-like [Ixodes scapularis]
MEPIPSSSWGDGAAPLGETSSPLKVTEDISFRCCSCTYVTKDQHGIVSHLVAHVVQSSFCPLHHLYRPWASAHGAVNTVVALLVDFSKAQRPPPCLRRTALPAADPGTLG